MRQTTGLSKTIAVILLILLVVGMGGYVVSQVSQIGGERKPCRLINIGESNQEISPYEEQMLLQELYANNLQKDIVSVIEQVVGKGGVRATVWAQLDLSQEKVNRQNLSRQLRVEELLENIGSVVRKLSVSIVIDGQMVRNERGHLIYQPRTKAEMAQYIKLAKGIMGFDEERGDVIEVLNLPFANRPRLLMGFTFAEWIKALCFVVFVGLMFGLIWCFVIPLLQSMTHLNETGGKATAQHLLNQVERLCNQSSERAAGVVRRALKQPISYRDRRQYGVAEMVAVVLLVIHKSIARDICRYLSEDELRQLGRLTERLGTVPTADVHTALAKFIRYFNSPVGVQGTPEIARRFMQEVHPNGKRIYLKMRLTEKGTTIWERLNQLDIGDLSSFLQHQKPEEAALILSALSDEKAGRILTVLPPEVSRRILIHLSHLKRIHPAVLDKLSMEIAPAVDELLRSSAENSGPDRIADIMKTLTKKEQEKLMAVVGKSERNTEGQIKSYLKQWDDIMQLPHTAMCQLLKYSDQDVFAKALSDLPVDVIGSFAKYMTPAAWQTFRQKIERADKQEAEAARKTILKTARILNLFG